MVWKKILRFVLIAVLAIVLLLIVFVAVSVAPVDRTPAREYSSVQETLALLEKLDTLKVPLASKNFSVGYAKVNLTPAQRTATAGYSKRRRKLFTTILDSIYIRAMVVDNGTQKVAIVSADLLIMPPTVTELLNQKLASTGFSLDNTYLGATHSHNSIGNWGEGAAQFIYGTYQDSIVHFIADKIVASIVLASENVVPAEIRAGVIAVPQAVDNRMIDGGPEDSLLRIIEVHRSDSSKLVLMSYTAHATCLFSRDLELSRDYPGALVDTLEAQGYNFAMFMAGAVGSHGCDPPEYGKTCIGWMAGELSNAFLLQRKQLKPVKDSVIMMVRLPLMLSDPQIKITPEWKVRSWLFRATFGEYPVYLTTLRLGDVVFLGTPCDFSGEFNSSLDSLGVQNGLLPVITSFNGGYIGYITPHNRYDIKHYETQLMNWYSPGTGEYLEECLEGLMLIVKGSNDN
jgi:neutral ceramidase